MKVYEKILFFGMILLAEPAVVGLMRLEGWPHGGDYPKTMDSMCAENALAKSAHGCSTRPPSTISFAGLEILQDPAGFELPADKQNVIISHFV